MLKQIMSNDPSNPISSDFSEIDKLVHEPARLAVMSLLYVVDSADFTFVINQTGLTWGNLSSHLSRLEEAGYLEVQKSFKGKRPNTSLKLTQLGRESFQKYVNTMKDIFDDYS